MSRLWNVRATVTSIDKSVSQKALEELLNELSESMRDSAQFVQQVLA
jgi:hypothetical protein